MSQTSEIVIIASFIAKPGKEAEALAASQRLLTATHAEEGCLLYALHQAADDPRRLAMVERWASKEALEAHGGTPHILEARAQLEDLYGDDIDIVVYEPRPGGQEAKGSLAGQADAG